MEERQVEVIKKVEGPVIRDRRLVGKPLTITRKRVAAYVRVSTNAEPMRMCPMEQEPSTQGSTHSAVCVSVVSVERILQGVPIIRIHSIKSLYGNAGRQPIKELKTVRIARQLMRLS